MAGRSASCTGWRRWGPAGGRATPRGEPWPSSARPPRFWLLAGWAAGWVSRDYPGLTVAPDLSWLLRREYLLALVAVGLAVGVLHVFRLRRRHARATRLQRPDASPRL